MKITKNTRNRTLVAVATLSFVILILLFILKIGSGSITGLATQEDSPDSGQNNVLSQGLGPDMQQPIGVPPTTEIEDETPVSSGNNFVSGGGGNSGNWNSRSNENNNPNYNQNNSNNNQSNNSNNSSSNQNNNSSKKKLKNIALGLDLMFNGNPVFENDEFNGKVRFGLERQNKKISDFDIDFDNLVGDADFYDIFGDSDFGLGMAFMHHGSGILENISLYVPVKPDDVAVVICSNASSYDEIYVGCSELPHITNEEVLYLPHPRVTLSSDGLYYIVSGITGTGVMGANVSVLGSESSPDIPPGEDPNAIAGNITELAFPNGGFGETQSWQGYFGNVTGVIALADGNDNVLYNWSLGSPEGVILASTNESITWDNIQCFNFTATGDYTSESGQGGTTSQYGTNLTQLENLYNIDSNDMDGVDETFILSGLGTHNTFYLNNNEFEEGECMNTRVFSDIGSGEDDKFEEALLYEPSSYSIVFAGLLNEDVIGFDDDPHDFEMLVLEDGHDLDTQTTTYYFYTQMH